MLRWSRQALRMRERSVTTRATGISIMLACALMASNGVASAKQPSWVDQLARLNTKMKEALSMRRADGKAWDVYSQIAIVDGALTRTEYLDGVPSKTVSRIALVDVDFKQSGATDTKGFVMLVCRADIKNCPSAAMVSPLFLS
jgi:hypothetical protein